MRRYIYSREEPDGPWLDLIYDRWALKDELSAGSSDAQRALLGRFMALLDMHQIGDARYYPEVARENLLREIDKQVLMARSRDQSWWWKGRRKSAIARLERLADDAEFFGVQIAV